jgi:hypothetical protein
MTPRTLDEDTGKGCPFPKSDRRHASIELTSMDGVADDSDVEVSLVLLGAVVLAMGVAGACALSR